MENSMNKISPEMISSMDDSCFNESDLQAIDEIINSSSYCSQISSFKPDTTKNLPSSPVVRKAPKEFDSPLLPHKRQKMTPPAAGLTPIALACSGMTTPMAGVPQDVDDDLSGHTLDQIAQLEQTYQVPQISQPPEMSKTEVKNVQEQISGSQSRRMLEFINDTRENLNDTIPSHEHSTSTDTSFFGLPLLVKDLITSYKDIKELYNWQEECLSLDAIKEKKNLIYSLPTSGGKTLVAEILILREILCHKKNVIFVLPYVSIVQEKVRSLSPFALTLGFLVEEYAGGRGQYPPRKRRWKNVVYVATIEKSLGLVNSLLEAGRLQELGLVVVDELHMVGEPGRGATLELLLTRIIFANVGVQVVGMSATIGNLLELAQFLKAETYTCNFRPVELKEHVKLNNQLFLIQPKAEDPFVLIRTLPPPVPSRDSVNVDSDQLGVLVGEVVPDSSCLVFCPTKKNCENVAQRLCEHLPRTLLQHNRKEKRALYKALKEEGSGAVCPILKKTLEYGVAYHHSGLTMSERNLLEEGFRDNALCCLCCTSTLASGVNLPAKRVILRSPYVGTELLSHSQYKQMVGRAGRAGMDKEGESVLVCQQKDLQQVRGLLGSEMNECLSQLLVPQHGGVVDKECPLPLHNLVLSSIVLGQAGTTEAVILLARSSLLAVQAERLGVDLEQQVRQVIQQLLAAGALKQSEDTAKNPQGDGATLDVSEIGKAAIKANLSISRARSLQKDLEQAQKGLNLATTLHLLYLLTPPDFVEKTTFSPTIFANMYLDFKNKADEQTVNMLGISESAIGPMLSGSKPKSVPLPLLKRVYVTLLLRAAYEGGSVWEVAQKFELPRGDVQAIMSSAAAYASNVQHFCQELLGKFWCFSALLPHLAERLAHCCSAELLPLMELPTVKKGRARLLFNAGYKTLHDVSNADPKALVAAIPHLSARLARHIISSATVMLLERVESLREDAEVLLEGVQEAASLQQPEAQQPTLGTPQGGTQVAVPHASWASPHLHSQRLTLHETQMRHLGSPSNSSLHGSPLPTRKE